MAGASWKTSQREAENVTEIISKKWLHDGKKMENIICIIAMINKKKDCRAEVTSKTKAAAHSMTNPDSDILKRMISSRFVHPIQNSND